MIWFFVQSLIIPKILYSMQTIILSLLAFFAKNIIAFHKPKVIGITGTVGKTTVTAHVHGYLTRALSNEKVGYSADHYNGEYGLPLTIIWAKTGWKNPFRWIWVFLVAISRFFRPFPRYIVLEYWIDHPGEMDFLLDIAVPDIAILTEVTPNHIEQFGTFDLYKKEKLKITRASGELIIHDSLRNSVEREAFYYGTWGMSEIDVSHVRIEHTGTIAQVHFHGRDYPISVRAFGAFHIVNILPLYAIAEIWGLSIDEIATYASLMHSEPGRSNILEWIEGSTIIDGSYNGWYLALHAGISSMRSFESTYNLIFLLGDMRELWKETESMHKKLTEEIIDMLPHKAHNITFFLVWPYMKEYVLPMLSQYFEVRWYLSSRIAWSDIRNMLSKKQTKPTMVFVKWSQNTIFLEEAIELLLARPEDMSRLCRQTPDWKRKKEEFFESLK